MSNDVLRAWRSLARSPAYVTIATANLALGLGATWAIASVIYGVLLKPLAYERSPELVAITSESPQLGVAGSWLSSHDYRRVGAESRAFSDLGAFVAAAVNLEDGEPERITAGYVSATLLRTLQVAPALGRWFLDSEDLPFAEPVVILSRELWRDRYAASDSIVGRRIQVDGVPRTVVGVMPAGFDVLDSRSRVWLPLGIDPAGQRERTFLTLIARLAPGQTFGAAAAELAGIQSRWPAGLGVIGRPDGYRFHLSTLHDAVVGDAARGLWILGGAGIAVLLLSLANMATLALARAEVRASDLAIRAALGATTRRLLQPVAIESLTLGVAAGALGVGGGTIALRLLLDADPASVPRSAELHLNAGLVGITLVLAVLLSSLGTILPFVQQRRRRSLSAALRAANERATASREQRRLRHLLVVVEVALAALLVGGAGLMVRSYQGLLKVDVGFDVTDLTTFQLVLPPARISDPSARARFFGDVAERLRRAPGIRGATAMRGLSPWRELETNDTEFEHVKAGAEPVARVAFYQFVTADYIQTMRVPIRRGRGFESVDAAGTAPVVLVNDAFVRRHFDGADPVGQRIRPAGGDLPWFTIIGVVGDAKQGGLDAPAASEVYFLIDQTPGYVQYAPRSMNVVVRSTLAMDALAPIIRREVAAAAPGVPIHRLRTMQRVLADSMPRKGALATLLRLFGIAALGLATLGIYGMLAGEVAARRRELAIRAALGASRWRLLQAATKDVSRAVALGLALGLVAYAASARLLGALLFGVHPLEPMALAFVVATIIVVAAIAAVVPAVRATRIDPAGMLDQF